MKKRLALVKSLIALLLCLSMLVGTTFAWFTDSVKSGINTIAAGVLDVELYHSNAAVTDERVNSATKLFMDLQGKPILWEPGVVSYENLRVANEGDLALAYQLAINTANENYIVEPTGEQYGLSQILKVGVVPGGITATDRAGVVASVAETDWTTMSAFLRSGSLLPEEGKSEETWGIVVYWQPGENDNNWNLNNGKTLSSGEMLQIDLGIKLVATQEVYESDSFGNDYDTDAKAAVFPDFVGGSASATVVPNEQNQTSAEVSMSSGAVAATVPAGVQLADGATQLTLDVSMMGASGANIALGENEDMRSLDVHIGGVAADNTVPMTITLKEVAPKGLNMGNYKLYHVEADGTKEMTLVDAADAFTAHNQFKYDPATGDITLYMATFSEVALVADLVNAWNGDVAEAFAGGSGTEAAPYLIANADQLAYLGDRVSNDNANYGSAYYKLISNINIGGIENYNTNGRKVLFYPIGYNKVGGTTTDKGNWYTYGGSFKGVFDGTGHTISGIYQNTWAMVGDYDGTYYNAAMGLFGYVSGGTVKNLAVSDFSSDGEFTPTGVIAAYADGDAKFENIAIFKCNPRVYNTGNGGIIGIAGDTRATNDDHITLKNITVDNSNKISALWGSYDVACGGLVGMYRGNVDGNGNATGDTISFTNCHVSAQIDVYNDVCGNYQYYAYRYAGMIIGSIRHNTTSEGKTIPNMAGITATGCTVNYGDWNDYYYCEFEKNGHPSYSGPNDYKFSRVPHSELNFTDSNGNGVVDASERDSVTDCKHGHTDAEDNKAIFLPFYQLFTGYSWGVSSIGLEAYSGIVTDLGITEGDQEASSLKFDSTFPNTTVNEDTGVVQTSFLYRVGNLNEIAIGNLFKSKDGATINDAGVYVRIDKRYEDANVSCAFTPTTTGKWGDGKLKFNGTGVVDIVIQDYDFCEPTILHLEVVDAVNATTATSATKNNVVLLKDCGFSSLEVSGGYTLYGNGFTMTCGSDSVASDMGSAFVTLNNGTLDNVQIICPNFDYAALYKSNLTSGDNRSETDANGKTRYYNAKSGVMVSGNSQILNSRITGGRAAVNVSGGNVVIDNSRVELGAVASILVGAANSLTLRDVTLVQKPTASTYDTNKKLMGFSVLYLCDSEGKATPTTLEGALVQYAWVNADDKQYVPSIGQDIVDGVMKETAFIHNINGKDSLNLGFAYMPEDAQKTVAAPDNITDNRTDKATVPYEMKDVKIQISILSTTVYVYSYKNTNGTADSFKTESDYKPDKYGDIITVTYTDTADGLTTSKTFGTNGWVYELNVDLDKLSGYALDFSKMSMSVNGVTVTEFKVDGNAKPTSPVAVTAGGTTYTLTATVNDKAYTATYKVTGTETSKESPSLVGTPSYGAGFGVANKYGGDWSAAAPVLDGITIKYWSVADSEYKEFALSSITFANTGKQNGTNNYWEYTHTNNDFTLKLTNTAVMHSNSGTYGMPVAGKDGKLYFTVSKSSGFVSTGTTSRSIAISYEFTDNNGGDTLKFSHTWSIPYSKDEQYNYSSFTSDGTLTKLESSSSSGGGCVTPETLVTLADGRQKRIDQVKYTDQLLVWDFLKGEYTVVPSALIVNHGYGDQTIIKLTFDDGTAVKAITAHSFFDADTNKWELINASNAHKYVGHAFVQADGDGYTTTKLVNVKIYEEYTESYSLVSAVHYNFITEDMFSLTNSVHNMLAGLEVGKNMTYDKRTLESNIKKYGTYTYADFAKYIPYQQYLAFNGDYLKISVGKGYITFNDILALIETYL